MRVMLVDDERIILTGLERILRRKWPELEVEAHGDAASALVSIAGSPPELLLTDVYMPVMDGLSLIEEARKHGARSCAILTGYDDFQLARRAIRLHTVDYLLKPVKKDELFALVEQVRGAVAAEEQARSQKQCEQLRLLLLHNVPPEDLDQTLGMPGTAFIASSRVSADETLRLLRALSAGFPTRHIVRETESGCMAVCFTRGGVSADREVVRQMIEDSPLKNALDEWMLVPYDKHRLREAYLHTTLTREQQFSRALDALRRADGGETAPICEYVTGKLQGPDAALWRMEKLALAAELDIPFWQLARFACARLADGRWAETLGGFFFSAARRRLPKSEVVVKTVEYITVHLSEHIGLPHMAELVYLQQGYFSTVFSKEMGTTFVKYLNRLRVTEACRRIAGDPSQPFAEIALRCGLGNLQYFFRIFKRYTGTTPGEFRVMILALKGLD